MIPNRFDPNFLAEVEAVALWIGDELASRGINVRQAKEKLGYVRVYVEKPDTPEKCKAYKDVYLEAWQRFSNLDRSTIYDDADYPELLQ